MKILLTGLDPETIDFSAPGVPPGMTAEKLLATITDVQKRFADQGDHLNNCKVKLDGSAEATVTAQLARETYGCILVGGGIEDPKNREMFERILNSILRHASGVPIGLVHLPKDAPGDVARVLSQGSTAPTQPHDRAAHVLSLMEKGDDASNRQDIAAMNAAHHPYITGSDRPMQGRRDDIQHGTRTAPDFGHAVRLTRLIGDVEAAADSGFRVGANDWLTAYARTP